MGRQNRNDSLKLLIANQSFSIFNSQFSIEDRWTKKLKIKINLHIK